MPHVLRSKIHCDTPAVPHPVGWTRNTAEADAPYLRNPLQARECPKIAPRVLGRDCPENRGLYGGHRARDLGSMGNCPARSPQPDGQDCEGSPLVLPQTQEPPLGRLRLFAPRPEARRLGLALPIAGPQDPPQRPGLPDLAALPTHIVLPKNMALPPPAIHQLSQLGTRECNPCRNCTGPH